MRLATGLRLSHCGPQGTRHWSSVCGSAQARGGQSGVCVHQSGQPQRGRFDAVAVLQATPAKQKVPQQPPAMTVPDRKLRFLCLHGYLQNAEVFKSRIGSLRKALKSRAEFVFVDAPFLAEPSDEDEVREMGGGDQGRTWWRWQDLEPGTRPSRAAHYTGWEASQAAIEEALQQHHPIDGLLGFSQGATAAALFLSHAGAALPPSLRMAVLIGGFMPRDAAYAGSIAADRPSLPALVVSGAGDTLVPEERSRQLAEAFAEGAVRWYQHPGGHMVPTCSGEFKQALVAFLDDYKAAQPSG